MPVKSYSVSCMLMMHQCIFNLEDFPKINRSTSIKNSRWIMLNQLTLNVEKTKYMIFHKRRK